MKKGILLICLFAAVGCHMPAPQTQEATADSTVVYSVKEPVSNPSENWSYSQQEDKMTNKPIYFAKCDATNQFNFSFPYEGGSTLSILVRKMAGKNEVILQISKGQFSSPYNFDVSMKFDNGKIYKYEFSEAADGSSDYIFLHPSSSIIQKLKKAKEVKVEAPFFEQGRQVAEFNVSGLKWEY